MRYRDRDSLSLVPVAGDRQDGEGLTPGSGTSDGYISSIDILQGVSVRRGEVLKN